MITAKFIAKHHPNVMQLMFQRQEEQTGKKDWSVFEFGLDLPKWGGGFDWGLTQEGHEPWRQALVFGNFAPLYALHPEWGELKPTEPKPQIEDEYYKWLECKIEQTREDKDLQREHWAFCQAMKKYRQIN